MENNQHIHYMKRALDLAREGLGRTAPNPSVGCVIVKEGRIVGQGRTADQGRPHAEIVALTQAGTNAKGANVYVSLEPCSHTGKTPPCCAALIKAGASHVIMACTDPNPKVNGKGVTMLQEAGIKVTTGMCEAEAIALNKGFFLTITQNRPLVTLKMAISADKKVAAKNGAAVQISCPEAQKHMHRTLRAHHDGILIGARTLKSDNPSLTTRYLPQGIKHNTKRFILSSKTTVDKAYKAFEDQENNPTSIINQPNLKASLEDIAINHDVTRLLVEGGAQVMSQFLQSGLWDQLYLYHSAHKIGDSGINAPNFDANQMQHIKTDYIGTDRLEVYKPPE